MRTPAPINITERATWNLTENRYVKIYHLKGRKEQNATNHYKWHPRLYTLYIVQENEHNFTYSSLFTRYHIQFYSPPPISISTRRSKFILVCGKI